MIVFRPCNVITDEENPCVRITVDTLNETTGAMTLAEVGSIHTTSEEPEYLYEVRPRAEAYNVTVDPLREVEVTVHEIVQVQGVPSHEMLERWVGTVTPEVNKPVEFVCSGEDMVGFKVYVTPISEEDEEGIEYTYCFYIENSLRVEPDDPTEEIVVDDMDRKYAITSDTCEVYGKTLSRIVALKDFANVRAGEFGGYVESEDNLSQSGNCWIYDIAAVMGTAYVCDDAQVRGGAVLRDSAVAMNKAKVLGNALICDEAVISGNAIVSDFACVAGDSFVTQTAKVQGSALVRDALIKDHSCVQNYACVLNGVIEGHAYIMGNSIVDQDVLLGGFSRLDNRSVIVEDTNSLGSVYVRLESLTTGVEGMCFEKVEGENTYRINVVEGETLPIIAKATDPRSALKVLYLGNDSLEEGINISDDPRIGWPVGTAGMTDTLAILIENKHFADVRGVYTIEVTVVEKPQEAEEPEEPSIIEEPLLKNIRIIPDHASVSDDEYIFDIPVNQNVTIIPELRDDAELVEIVFQGFDISDTPTVFYPDAFLGQADEIEVVVRQKGSQDVVTYTVLFHIVPNDKEEV